MAALDRPRTLDHHSLLFTALRAALFAALAGCAVTQPIVTQPRPGDRYIGRFGTDGLEHVAVFRQQRLEGNEVLLRCSPKPECKGRRDLADRFTVMRDCVDWGQPCQMEVQ